MTINVFKISLPRDGVPALHVVPAQPTPLLHMAAAAAAAPDGSHSEGTNGRSVSEAGFPRGGRGLVAQRGITPKYRMSFFYSYPANVALLGDYASNPAFGAYVQTRAAVPLLSTARREMEKQPPRRLERKLSFTLPPPTQCMLCWAQKS